MQPNHAVSLPVRLVRMPCQLTEVHLRAFGATVDNLRASVTSSWLACQP